MEALDMHVLPLECHARVLYKARDNLGRAGHGATPRLSEAVWLDVFGVRKGYGWGLVDLGN